MGLIEKYPSNPNPISGNQTQSGSVTPPGQGSTLFTSAHQQAPYLGYSSKTTYIYKTGAIQLPNASPSGTGVGGAGGGGAAARSPCSVIQTSAPVGKKIFRFKAAREGVPPALPTPDPNDANQVLEMAIWEYESPTLREDGVTHVYRLAGTYTYILLRPLWGPDGLLMGACPYDTSPSATVPSGNFQPLQ